MSEGFTIAGLGDEVAGIVVRQQGERGYRFHSASKIFDALNGHVFVSPQAAQRTAREFAALSGRRRDEAVRRLQ
ncbi:MAG: hypothetical protein NW223_06110 [Hyphomicrobiaceae bacterium]|nr:hypothetical protein [Hyphomicrobiaceae bacterium]